jgi:mannose-1-phosphate guanylyltransferase
MRAFLLAAGLGTRMGDISQKTPKCLLPVGGQPLLGRWFDELARVGVTSVLVNTHHLAEQVQAYVAASTPPLDVVLSHEEKLLGSGGTLRSNRGFVRGEESFLVVYADNASTVDFEEFLREHRADVAATLGLFRVPDPQNKGIVCLGPDGLVEEFTEKPAVPRSDLAWAGLLVGTPGLLEVIPERVPCDLGHDVLPLLIGQMRGMVVRGKHADVGTPDAYQRVCADFEEVLLP